MNPTTRVVTNMHSKLHHTLFAILSFLILFATESLTTYAASPGLPFTEDFSSDALIDRAKTTAEVDTEEHAVRLAWAQRTYPNMAIAPAFNNHRPKAGTGNKT